MPDRKKILMVATGGTIASMDEGQGLTPKLTTEEILSTIPEVKDICRIEALQLMNLDSTNIGPKEWQEIAQCILREYDNYDGFVVTHGTDTMAYTAAALSYMIQKSPKPVVITGSQKSIFLRDTDARVNLLDSFVYAADPGSWGVSIVFNGKAILGTRARKERSKSYNAFNSVDYPEAAVIRNGRVIRYLTRPSLEDGPVISTNMEGRILLLTLIPGMSAKVLQNSMEDYDAVILRSFGVGGLPGSDRGGLAEALREWTEHGKLVVMMTQVPYEGSDMNVYQVGQKIKHLCHLIWIKMKDNKFLVEHTGLNTQLVLSTHSNHVVNELDLNCMRYFRREVDSTLSIPISNVVNLSNTFGTDDATKRFVTRYIRLTHCDIFFADAVILVEGPAEKILVPKFIKKEDLDSYYISVIEVNGRHAHSFRSLLEKTGIATLVVTDIDAAEKKTGEDGKEHDSSVITAKRKNYHTGNPTIKTWIAGAEKIDDLLTLTEAEKIVGNIRIAFQTPINVKWDEKKDDVTEICPYTFEDALVMTNLSLFQQDRLGKQGAITTIGNLCKNSTSAIELQTKIFEKLEHKGGFQKADFANGLLYSEQFDSLESPAYIREGLIWMKKYLDSNGTDNGK